MLNVSDFPLFVSTILLFPSFVSAQLSASHLPQQSAISLCIWQLHLVPFSSPMSVSFEPQSGNEIMKTDEVGKDDDHTQ